MYILPDIICHLLTISDRKTENEYMISDWKINLKSDAIIRTKVNKKYSDNKKVINMHTCTYSPHGRFLVQEGYLSALQWRVACTVRNLPINNPY